MRYDTVIMQKCDCASEVQKVQEVPIRLQLVILMICPTAMPKARETTSDSSSDQVLYAAVASVTISS